MRSALASKVSNWKKKEKSESVKNSTPSLFSYCDFQIYMTFIAKSLHLMNTIIEIKLISYIKDAIMVLCIRFNWVFSFDHPFKL